MSNNESDEETPPSSSTKLQPTGHGYSVKTPRQKKWASLLRAQGQAEQVRSPREVNRQNLRSQKIEQPLGGNRDGVSIGSDVELRAHRIKHLRRLRREEKAKKLARSTIAKSKERPIGGRLASLSVNEKQLTSTPSKSDERILFIAKGRAQFALNIAMDEVGQKERTNLLVLTLRKILLNARDDPSKRLLKLTNLLFWERVARFFCGRAILNAAGFVPLESGEVEPPTRSNEMGNHVQPLDTLEINLKSLGRERCILTVKDNFNLDLIDGALDAVTCFLSGTGASGNIKSNVSQKA